MAAVWCSCTSLQSSVSVVTTAMRTYVQLSFWMPTPKLQLLYVEQIDIRPVMGMQEEAMNGLANLVIFGSAFKVSIVGGLFAYHLKRQARIKYEEHQLRADLVCCFNMHRAAHVLMANAADQQAPAR